MTLPYERTRAVVQTEEFLKELVDPAKTPRVPRSVRMQAARLLRHYPCKYLMEQVAERDERTTGALNIQVFGKDEQRNI